MENKTNSTNGFGIACLILGIVGMLTTCLFFGIIPCILSLIFGLIGIFQKNKSKTTSIIGLVCSTIGILLFICIIVVVNYEPKEKTPNLQNEKIETNVNITDETLVENENITVENTNETDTDNFNVIEEKQEEIELTEEEYKSLCNEYYYDDIFFSDNINKGDFVKAHLMISENYYFDADALYSDSFSNLMDEWSLYRDFKKCSVLRENENSYAGKGKIDLYFSEKYEYDPTNYDLGIKIIVYGEIISFSNNTWDGYNSVTIIPKYIEYE